MLPSTLRSLLALSLLVPTLWGAPHAAGTSPSRAAEAPARLQAHNADARDLFGAAVALSRDGQVLVVGADLEASRRAQDSDDNSLPGAGAVYVFEREGSHWRETAYLKAPLPQAGAGFGFAVALSDDGSTLAVAAPFAAGEGEGAVHVFRRATGAWSALAELPAPAGVRRFGERLALSTAGSELAVSGIAMHDGVPQAVQAHVYAWRALQWSAVGQVAQPIETPTGHAPTPSLALAGDGRRLALGSSAGAQVQLFDWRAAGWTPSHTLATDAVHALAMAADGRTVAVTGADGRITVHADNAARRWMRMAQLGQPQAPQGAPAGRGLALSADGQVLVARVSGPAAEIHRFQRRGDQWYGPTTLAAPVDTSDPAAAELALSADGRTLAVGARFEPGTVRWSWPWRTDPLPGAGAVHLYSPA